jgi:hypothetical protein
MVDLAAANDRGSHSEIEWRLSERLASSVRLRLIVIAVLIVLIAESNIFANGNCVRLIDILS